MSFPSFRHLRDEDITIDPATEALGAKVLAASRVLAREIGLGLAERIYESALEIVLTDDGIAVERQAPVVVRFRGRDLGVGRRVDLLVGGTVAVEVKSAAEMHPAFETQLLTYMRGRELELGYIVNFGMSTLAQGIRRKVITRIPRE